MNYPPHVWKYPFTGTGAIIESATVPADSGRRRLVSITAHFNGDPGVEDLVISLFANAGVAYNTVLKRQPMSGVVDFVWYPSREQILDPGDEIDIAMTGAAGRVYGIEVTMREVS